ncbi:hypothetical protein [Aeromonas veronii]|uniref:hypothetical protein n=1 Tax=Aeromonas veronii TaxID=654 RepID=UPI001600CBB8|nr:hypothetical protein [Aeromonas veronii]
MYLINVKLIVDDNERSGGVEEWRSGGVEEWRSGGVNVNFDGVYKRVSQLDLLKTRTI